MRKLKNFDPHNEFLSTTFYQDILPIIYLRSWELIKTFLNKFINIICY